MEACYCCSYGNVEGFGQERFATAFRAGQILGTFIAKTYKFVQRKGTTVASKFSVDNFAEKKEQFLRDLVTIVKMEEIPPELILNWGMKVVSSYSWTMHDQGARRVEIIGLSNKWQITAVLWKSVG